MFGSPDIYKLEWGNVKGQLARYFVVAWQIRQKIKLNILGEISVYGIFCSAGASYYGAYISIVNIVFEWTTKTVFTSFYSALGFLVSCESCDYVIMDLIYAYRMAYLRHFLLA